MRAILALLLCGAIASCATSNLGSCSSNADCSSNAICDSVQRVCVATDGPQIANVSVTTAPDYVALDGKLFFDTAGAPLMVSATITARAGTLLDPASACLRIRGEATCTHAGTAGPSNTFTFALPRPVGPADGTVLDFSISAATATGHSSTSPSQHVHFDDQPPSISIVDDAAVYARTLPDGGVAPIDVSVSIADGSGVVSPRLLSGARTIPPATATGPVYVFRLDPTDAPAGVEGAYGFQVAAQDNLGHSRQVSGSRKIDDAAPTVAVQIYKDAPDGGGVTYPAPVANTGWTGATFVYTDTVHVSGTVTDLSGVGSATLRVDGIELDGGIAAGASRSLGCTAGAGSCSFSLDLTLNDAGVAFHTGASTLDAGVAVGAIPAGDLRFTIDAKDTATASDGTQAPRAGLTTTAARATRLLWHKTLGGAAVSGLAVHPDGDLIASMDAGTADTVYALAADQPVTRWSVTLDASTPIAGVTGMPAIGAGDASNARIYVASAIGDLYALNPDGGMEWSVAIVTVNNISVGPAVMQTSGGVDQIVVPDGVGGGNSNLWRATSASDVTSVASDNRDFHAAPLILNGNVFFATQNAGGNTTHVTKHSIAANGALGAAVTSGTNGGVPYFGLITDGTNLYAATRPPGSPAAGVLVAMDASFKTLESWTNSALTSALGGEPTIGIDRNLYGSQLNSTLSTFDPASGARANFVTLAGAGFTPLQGSDGHLYVARRTSGFDAYDGNQRSWTFTAPAAILRYATMDCEGRVFLGAGATVYAFISDDRGLADTPWPSLRRDARNTGNAGALKYGIRTVSGCTQ